MSVYKFRSPSVQTLGILERMHAELLNTIPAVRDPAMRERLTLRCTVIAGKIAVYRNRVHQLFGDAR